MDDALNVMILIVAVLVLNFSAAIARRIIAVTMIPVSAMGHRRNLGMFVAKKKLMMRE